MILKQIDNKSAPTHLEKAGDEAEKQMAHYLKRAYQKSKDIHIINDLRLVLGDDTAQIDHLIVHRFGFIIIESKSVSTEVSYNELGEWRRTFKNKESGMASPIKQAERQAELLHDFLQDRSDELFKKVLLIKSSFSDFKFDVLVAVSDSGIINRAENIVFAEVHKADQITDVINKITKGYAATNNNLLSLKMNNHFANSSMKKIVSCLVNSHQPKTLGVKESKGEYKTNTIKPKENIEAAIQKTVENDKVCGKCKSDNIEIKHGRYGYYFTCRNCNGSTSINVKCKDSSCNVRLRKQKLNFYKECEKCNSSELYFVNLTTEQA